MFNENSGGQPAVQAPAAPAAQPAAPASPSGLPDGGHEKFYNPSTGAYNWEAHAREQSWQQQQRGQAPAQPQAPAPASSGNANIDGALNELANDVMNGGQGIQARVKLTQLGVPEALIESHVANVQSQREGAVNNVKSYAAQQIMGDPAKGDEAISQMQAYVAQNLPPEERSKLNRLVQTGNAQVAIDMVANMMRGSGGAPNTDFRQGGSGFDTTTPFSSQQEMIAAINKPEYRNDPQYRASVQARVLASKRG